MSSPRYPVSILYSERPKSGTGLVPLGKEALQVEHVGLLVKAFDFEPKTEVP